MHRTGVLVGEGSLAGGLPEARQERLSPERATVGGNKEGQPGLATRAVGS
jgi:hypothetical protein